MKRKPNQAVATYGVLFAIAVIAFLWLITQQNAEIHEAGKQLDATYSRMNNLSDMQSELERKLSASNDMDEAEIVAQISELKREIIVAAVDKSRIKSAMLAYTFRVLLCSVFGIVSFCCLLHAVLVRRDPTRRIV